MFIYTMLVKYTIILMQILEMVLNNGKFVFANAGTSDISLSIHEFWNFVTKTKKKNNKK